MPLFKDTGTSFTSLLAEAVQFCCYPKEEWVVRKGTVGEHMFIVTMGSVDILVDDNATVPINTLGRGSFFGERTMLGLALFAAMRPQKPIINRDLWYPIPF